MATHWEISKSAPAWISRRKGHPFKGTGFIPGHKQETTWKLVCKCAAFPTGEFPVESGKSDSPLPSSSQFTSKLKDSGHFLNPSQCPQLYNKHVNFPVVPSWGHRRAQVTASRPPWMDSAFLPHHWTHWVWATCLSGESLPDIKVSRHSSNQASLL